MITAIQNAVQTLLPGKRKTNPTTGWISFNAPCCSHRGESADTRGRGGVIMNGDGSVSYHCFNCNFTANYTPGRHLFYKFRKLLTWLGADDNTVKRLQIDALRIRELIAPEELVEQEQEEIKFKPRPLPENAKNFEQWSTYYTLQSKDPERVNVPADFADAVEYAYARGVDTVKYNLLWTDETEHNYHKRVIIPFTWRGEVIGSTARTFAENVKPKYYSDYEANYVFNLDQQHRDSKFVIVTEGPFDAMAVDGVAILGNECSETQADIIDSLGREVIVVPDADRAGVKLIDAAIEYGWSVSFPVWQETHKDPASAVEAYGRLFVVKTILDTRQSNKLKIELMKKKLYNKL